MAGAVGGGTVLPPVLSLVMRWCHQSSKGKRDERTIGWNNFVANFVPGLEEGWLVIPGWGGGDYGMDKFHC